MPLPQITSIWCLVTRTVAIFRRSSTGQLIDGLLRPATKQYFKENDFNSHRNSKNNLGKAFRSSKTEERSNYSGDFWKLRVWSSSRGCQQRERMAWWTWKGLRAFRERKMGKTQREESVRNQKSSNRLVMFKWLITRRYSKLWRQEKSK